MFLEMGFDLELPVELEMDSASAISTSNSHKITQRSKHIDVRCHMIREMIGDGRLKPVKVPGTENRADLATKPFDRIVLEKMRKRILSTIL
jgi:hypothetical protein